MRARAGARRCARTVRTLRRRAESRCGVDGRHLHRPRHSLGRRALRRPGDGGFRLRCVRGVVDDPFSQGEADPPEPGSREKHPRHRARATGAIQPSPTRSSARPLRTSKRSPSSRSLGARFRLQSPASARSMPSLSRVAVARAHPVRAKRPFCLKRHSRGFSSLACRVVPDHERREEGKSLRSPFEQREDAERWEVRV
jgi:hypothetical protein